jgi:hypothetical protein
MDPITTSLLKSSPVTKSFLENASKDLYTFLKGKIKRSFINSRIGKDNFYEMFQNFINYTFNRCKFLNILALENERININKIYLPISIFNNNAKDHTFQKISFHKINFEKINKLERILIEDQAGMGKSCLMKWIVYNLIVQQTGIPIFIELKKLNKDNSLLEEIKRQFRLTNSTNYDDYLTVFLEAGLFYILLDGYDEIKDEDKTEVTGSISDFCNTYDKNIFIITSRPNSSLVSFGGFNKYYMEQLSKEQAYEVIEKLDRCNKSKSIKKELINDVENKIGQVKEFLSNPFLVSLLYKTYTYNRDIPTKKITFYEELYCCLYKFHDLSKDDYRRDKFSKLDIIEFKTILKNIAFDSAKKNQIEFTFNELSLHVEKAKSNYSNLTFKVSEYIEDLISTVPLFIREGNLYRWSHKSLQDYFAAEYIVYSEFKYNILNQIYVNKKLEYFNILQLIFELDYKVFKLSIIKSLLQDFCENIKEIKSILDEKIEDSRLLLDFFFFHNLIFNREKLDPLFSTLRYKTKKGVLVINRNKPSWAIFFGTFNLNLKEFLLKKKLTFITKFRIVTLKNQTTLSHPNYLINL